MERVCEQAAGVRMQKAAKTDDTDESETRLLLSLLDVL